MSEVVAFDTFHSKSINDCVLDYYAKRLATCSSDNSVKVFDVSSLNASFCIAELRDHSAAVWKVCWSHPKYGGLLASCSYDKSIIVYKEIEANKYGKIYVNAEHKGSINSIEWAPYELGLHLGCASSDGFISIVSYNLNKDNNTEGCWHRYSVKAHLNGASCISWEKKSNAFSNESNLNETTDQFNSFKLVSGGFDNQVIVWLFDNNSKEFHKLFQMRDEPHKSAVKDVSWKPSVNNTANIIASCSDQQVILWEEDTNTNVWLNKQVIRFQNKIDKITWSPNGTILAVSCDNDNVFLYKENMDGVWNSLCNLGNNSTDMLSNDLNASLKDAPQTDYDNINEFTEMEREINEHNPNTQSYPKTAMYMNQPIGANISEMSNMNFNDQQHPHMKLNPMEAPIDNIYTQPGYRNINDPNKEGMVNNSAMNFMKPFPNNEPMNATYRNQSYMHLNKNANITQDGPISNEDIISREQYRTNISINPSTNNTFKNTATHFNESAHIASHNQYYQYQEQHQ